MSNIGECVEASISKILMKESSELIGFGGLQFSLEVTWNLDGNLIALGNTSFLTYSVDKFMGVKSNKL